MSKLNDILLIILVLIITILSFRNSSVTTYDEEPKILVDPISNHLPPPPTISPLREYDYRSLDDPLVAPRHRDDYTIPVMPVPTRGWPTAYKKIGTLINHNADNSDPYKFLFLIGRQKYPSADWYDYYVTETSKDGRLKFDVHHRHKEIFSGDRIEIPELNKTYEAKIDKTFDFEYNPYVI
jgi:hypothetical protein